METSLNLEEIVAVAEYARKRLGGVVKSIYLFDHPEIWLTKPVDGVEEGAVQVKLKDGTTAIVKEVDGFTVRVYV